MTIEPRLKPNKSDLLTVVQRHLAKLVNTDFDGNIIIPARKGYLGKVRSTPRETMDVFDPREAIDKRKILLED